MGNKKNNRSWIVLDCDEFIHARIHDADEKTALAIARAAFPEVPPENLSVVLRRKVCSRLRSASNTAVLLTAESCAKNGLVVPVEYWAEKLAKRFVRTMASGGGL